MARQLKFPGFLFADYLGPEEFCKSWEFPLRIQSRYRKLVPGGDFLLLVFRSLHSAYVAHFYSYLTYVQLCYALLIPYGQQKR